MTRLNSGSKLVSKYVLNIRKDKCTLFRTDTHAEQLASHVANLLQLLLSLYTEIMYMVTKYSQQQAQASRHTHNIDGSRTFPPDFTPWRKMEINNVVEIETGMIKQYFQVEAGLIKQFVFN